jgi:hypothetical protein
MAVLVATVLTVIAGLGQLPPVVYASPSMPVDVLADLPPHEASVGTLAGEAMAEGGAATYSIPIALPPGRKGMQPGFSLSYSSRSGAGTAGLGFSLNGLSSLHRCPRTPEQDGETRAARGDGSDRLCLDGQRLIVVDATTLAPIAGQAGYGANAAVYRSEVDNFVRVTQFGGALGAASSCFKVETKPGVVRYYGGLPNGGGCTNDARVVPGGAIAPLSWMLKQEIDSSGNTVNYNYADTDKQGAYGAGEVLLQGVTYTGHGADPGDRAVTFVYEPRPDIDQTSSYVAGGLTQQTRRLAAIGTFVAGSPVREYQLGYVQSAYSGRSLLQTVTECAYADGNPVAVCRSPTLFDYDDSGEIRWPQDFGLLTIPGLTSPMAQLSHDDAEAIAVAARNEAAVDPLSAQVVRGVSASQPSFVREIGDFDGDGTRELGIVHYGSGSPRQYLASYAADRTLRGLIDADAGLGMQNALSAGNQFADVNGDGRTDLIARRTTGGQRRIAIRVWKTTAANTWLPGNFDVYDLSITLPTTSGLSCEDVSFADMNADGRADLLLIVPASMVCGGTGVRELRIYLGQAGSNPLVPQFAASPSQSRTLGQITGIGGVILQEGISLMDFDGDGLPDVVVSRTADKAEQNRVMKLWFSRNTGGVYSLGGVGQEIASVGAFAIPALEGDEIHKQAYSTWMDVNGDGLQDWLSIKVDNSGSQPVGYWSVRLNQGGLLGPRRITDSTRGLERCINDPQVNSTNNNCATRWQPVFASRFRASDVDSDGRADLLLPRAFAARVCVRRVAQSASVPGEFDYSYWCPENPATGALDPFPEPLFLNDKHYGMYAPGGDAADGSEAGRYANDLDPSAYFLDALRFVQTSATTFSVETTGTDIVQGQSTFDLFGDGLADQVAYLGNPFAPSTLFPRTESYGLVGLGIGPENLPDGTRVVPDGSGSPNLQEDRLTFLSDNIGVGRIGDTEQLPRLESLPAPFDLQAATDLPRLPELLRTVTNGLGEKSSWTIVPLGAGASVSGLPIYSIPGQRYADARHYYFASSMPVVYAMIRSNGIGGSGGARTQVFNYQEAMFNHQGRGFQGFRAITAFTATEGQAVARELRTTTTYHQKYPLTGRVQSVLVAPSATGAVPLTLSSSDWRCGLGNRTLRCPGDGTSPAAPQRDTIYFPYLDRELVQNFDLTQAEVGVSSPVNAVETINAASESATASGWDPWGNLTRQTVLSRDTGTGAYPDGRFIDEHRKTVVRTYTSNASTWYLDQLDEETVTTAISYNAAHALPATASAPNRTLITNYIWNSDRTPSRQTVQSGIGHEELTTAWCYRTTSTDCPGVPGGTNYGLPSSVLQRAPDVSTTRRTSYAYSKNGLAAADDGYFVLTTTNALNQVVTTERRPRDGQVSRTIAPTLTTVVTTFDPFGLPVKVESRGTTSALIEPAVETAVSQYDGEKCSVELGVIGGGGETLARYCTTTVKSGAPTTVSWHDEFGRVVKRAQRGFDGSFIVAKTEYDLMGQVARQSMPRYAGAAGDQWQTRSYDRQGRVLRQVDPAVDLRAGNGDRLTVLSYAGQRTLTRVQDS